MAELLFAIAMLLQCGVFPMSPSDCMDDPHTVASEVESKVGTEAP